MYNVIEVCLVGVNMINKKNLGLVLGLVLSLYTISPAIAQEEVVAEDAATEQETTLKEESEVKVDRETPEKVTELINKKDYEAALPLIDAYIASKPKKYQGYKLRGDVYYALRRYDLAVQDYQKAVDIKTDNDKLATGTKVLSAVVLGADKQEQYQNPELGLLYARLMYAQKAVNSNMYEVSLKKALEYNSHQYLPTPKKEEISKINCPQKYGKIFNPQGVDADISAIIDDIEKKHFSEAVYKLPKLTSECPNYYLGQYLTGVVMVGMEQEQEAINAFHNALKLNPKDFESYASLGLLYYEKAEKTFNKDYVQKSIDNFNKAIALNPNCHTYYFYLGLNQLELGNYDIAVGNFKKSLSIKNNDYNSMYYKSIAQYLQKDYYGVISETTNMLYRRVSNYNSVLYLRALAYYKMKDTESAIADIEKIHQSLNDIYNIDVKPLTPKEQVLDTYLYYLQSRISRDNGMGAKSDLQKAYKNPVIALLDTRKNDFEHANFKLTNSDIEKQYEYLVTTFDDLGVGFEYLNPDYKIVAKSKTSPAQTSEKVAVNSQEEQKVQGEEKTQEPEVDKLPQANEMPQQQEISQKVEEQPGQQSESEVEESLAEDVETVQANDEDDMVKKLSEFVAAEKKFAQESQEEIAEKTLLAEENSPVTVFDPDTLIFASDNEQKEELPVAEKKEITENLTTENSKVEEEKPQLREDSDTQEVVQSENLEEPELVKQAEQKVEEVIQSEQTQSTELVEQAAQVEKAEQVEKQIEKVEQQLEEVMQTEQATQAVQDVLTDAENVLQTKETPIENKKINLPIKEKYANVDLSEFEVKTKKTPDVKEEDEVIFLEPESLFKKKEKEVQERLNNLTLVPASNVQPKDEKLALPATSSKQTVDVNITKISDEPVNVDEVSISEQSENHEEPALIEPEEINFPEKIVKSVEKASEVVADEAAVDETPTVKNFTKGDLTEKVVNEIETKEELVEEKPSEDAISEEPLAEDVKEPVAEEVSEENLAQEIQSEKPEKQKKIKKSKQKDNLIIAVGGNVDDYAVQPEEKVKKEKPKKKNKAKKAEKSDVQTPAIIEDEVQSEQTAESATLQTEEVSEINKEELPGTEQKPELRMPENQTVSETTQSVEEKELQQEPTVKKEVAVTPNVGKSEVEETEPEQPQETKVEEEKDVVTESEQPQVTKVEEEKEVTTELEQPQVSDVEEENEVAESEEVEDEQAQVQQKPKKISFWKRLFSRKKPAQTPEVEPVAE